MAEAEDVIVDVARHATIYARALWQRHQPADRRVPVLSLAAIAPRLDLLITALTGRSLSLRVAQAPSPPTLLTALARRKHGPLHRTALPATDGVSIWLPAQMGMTDGLDARERYRTMALQQAMRAMRGSAQMTDPNNPLLRDLYLLIEALAADQQLLQLLPGMRAALASLRRGALAARPAIAAFPAHLRVLEAHVRTALQSSPAEAWFALFDGHPAWAGPTRSLQLAQDMASQLRAASPSTAWGPHPLLKDAWTGELRARLATAATDVSDGRASTDEDKPTRSARLARRPEVREATDDEDDDSQGAWMVQTAQPHETAADPAGLQRPVDRDDSTCADEFADALSELPEARLVTRSGRPREVLLSDDPPDPRGKAEAGPHTLRPNVLVYPEWDYRIGAYLPRGSTVRVLPAISGPQSWVDQTLEQHRGMLHEIRRRFEMLRARRIRMHRQLDGDEIDLESYIEGYADFRAGLPLPQGLYRSQRRVHRDMAIMLLIDVSGSTDSWVVGDRRIIDVEREALLLVCYALEGMAQPYAVQAFSGEGPQSVILREVKRFDERFDNTVAQRVAGMEPEAYTRAGAALRHATSLLMREPAQHRLLLLLSDGKPNDIDHYEGRYGVEDMRQAVTEAKLQGISPFCLTIDRQAAGYLPFVFGPNHYALLPRPQLLPTVLLDWLRRLVGS